MGLLWIICLTYNISVCSNVVNIIINIIVQFDNSIAFFSSISVQKNSETKELSIVSCVFKLTAKVRTVYTCTSIKKNI